MGCRVLINGYEYEVKTSDVSKEYSLISPRFDEIDYRVELDGHTGTIYARIKNPSEHTKYLVDQGRCWLALNVRNFRGHGPGGMHSTGEYFVQNEHMKYHSSGLGRGSYRFHKRWSVGTTARSDYVLALPQKIENLNNNILITLNFQLSKHIYPWATYYEPVNVKGYSAIERYSDNYNDPIRNSFFFDIRLALLSNRDNSDYCGAAARVYQTRSKITRITFNKNID